LGSGTTAGLGCHSAAHTAQACTPVNSDCIQVNLDALRLGLGPGGPGLSSAVTAADHAAMISKCTRPARAAGGPASAATVARCQVCHRQTRTLRRRFRITGNKDQVWLVSPSRCGLRLRLQVLCGDSLTASCSSWDSSGGAAARVRRPAAALPAATLSLSDRGARPVSHTAVGREQWKARRLTLLRLPPPGGLDSEDSERRLANQSCSVIRAASVPSHRTSGIMPTRKIGPTRLRDCTKWDK
jgi:hypothetical protein